MKTGRPKKLLSLEQGERSLLNALATSRSMPYGLVTRARIILMAADGASNSAIAEKLSLSKPSVGKWRQRYLMHGIQGLHDELKPGRPRTISDEAVAALLRKTLNTKPKDGTHWSVRSMARQAGISSPTVNRIWRAFGIQPHRQRHFKLSTDPFFVEKVRDIVGLYLHPPRQSRCALCR